MAATDNIDRSWWPSVDQVAAILYARTLAKDEGASDLEEDYRGTFDTTTSPTKERVEAMTELAVGAFLGLTGGHEPCTDVLKLTARTQVVLFISMLAEASYRPENTGGDDTAFEAIRKLWQPLAQAAADTIASSCPLGTDTPDPTARGGALGPRARLPLFQERCTDGLPVPPMLGRRRAW
jgi:hypothetical protein